MRKSVSSLLSQSSNMSEERISPLVLVDSQGRLQKGAKEAPSPVHSSSLQLRAARAVVHKYRRYVREVEFERLRTLVPTVANKHEVEKSEILEESIKYISELHKRLLEKINSSEPVLNRLREAAGVRRREEASVQEGRRRRQPTVMSSQEMQAVLQRVVETRLRRSLKAKRRRDRQRIGRILLSAVTVTGCHQTGGGQDGAEKLLLAVKDK